jgi:hypothetical protein
MFSQAQDQKAKKAAADKWQLFGGYTFQHANEGIINAFSYGSGNADFFAPFNSNGLQVSASYFPFRYVGLTTQMTFVGTGDKKLASNSAYTQNISQQSFLIGPAFRYTIGNSRFTLFEHELIGATRNSFSASYSGWEFCQASSGLVGCSVNDFTLVAGGGLDYRITKHISVRPAQLEYWREEIPEKGFAASNGSGNFDGHGLRYTAGAVFNF